MYLLPSTIADEPKEPNTEAQPYVYATNVPIPIFNPCSCVSYVKAMLGISEPLGVARFIKVDSTTPKVGDIIITYESSLGHAAIITKIEDGYLYLKEANYQRCKVSYDRKLAINNPIIKGYISK